MGKRILILAAFLVLPPAIGSLAYRLLIYQPVDLSWVPTLLAWIGGWAAFWGGTAEITGYSLRDFIAGRGRWRPQPDGDNLGGATVASLSASGPRGGEGLKIDLERANELLEVTQKRLHALEMKKQEFGPSALTAEEAAELRDKEREVYQLTEVISRLEKQIKG
jgi:hypothetical protein